MNTKTTHENKLIKFLNKEYVVGYIFASPFIVGFIMFLLIPLSMSFYYSLCKYNILSPATFVGLSNYVTIFTNDSTFIQALQATLYFAFVSVPMRLVFALIVAVILVESSKLSGVYRAVYYLPSILGGSVSVAILWKRFFAGDGAFNGILSVFGYETTFSWLSGTTSAMWVLIALAVWQFGSSMLIFLAALKQIPVSLYEAAGIDGSNRVNTFFRITLPLLTPTIFFNLIIQSINGFLAFTQALIITNGKPLNSTLFYVLYMYNQTFDSYNAGYASALAWVMLVIISVYTVILFATKKFWVYDGGF